VRDYVKGWNKKEFEKWLSDILPTLPDGEDGASKQQNLFGTQELLLIVPDSQTLLAFAERKGRGSVSTGVIGSAQSMPTESLT
jgi:hypothetical protein